MKESPSLHTSPTIQLIETDSALNSALTSFQNITRLAVDLEGEWNLHRYGLHLCLIQLYAGGDILLVDPLKVKNLRPVWDMLENPSILKISHGCQSDMVLLDYRFDVHPKNTWDTQKAAQLLGYEATSLSGLLERYVGISKNMKVRVSDWNKRPLNDKMIQYAAMDVEHLFLVIDKLEEELKVKDRWEWFTEECALLEEIRHVPKENPHLEINGVKKLNRKQKQILKAIYGRRERIAESLDKPAYHIIANDKLIPLSENPPKTINDWKNMTGVHASVARNSQEFFSDVAAAQLSPLEPWQDRKEYPPFGFTHSDFKQWTEDRTTLMEPLKARIEQDYPDVAPMIMSSRTLRRIAYGEITVNDLRKWQQDIIKRTAALLELDLSRLDVPESIV